MKDLLLTTLLAVGLSILLLVVVAIETGRPDVYKSWSSCQCVKVQSDSGHDCDNLPEKYSTVWVQ